MLYGLKIQAIDATHHKKKLTADLHLSDAALRDIRVTMNDDCFNRAPGAERARHFPADPGLVGSTGNGDSRTPLFNQREPLRQPRTSPPYSENSTSAADATVAGGMGLSTS